MKKELTEPIRLEILEILEERFELNLSRHKNIDWAEVRKKLGDHPGKLWSLNEMERSGGEPDLVDFDMQTGEYIFIDCSKESPVGRRSLCYDRKALDFRKSNKPKYNAMDLADDMGITLLTEAQYMKYHPLVNYDHKTSSWVLTPDDIRILGGAIFCDFRFGRVFTYHNGAESYYQSRGFRGLLRV